MHTFANAKAPPTGATSRGTHQGIYSFLNLMKATWLKDQNNRFSRRASQYDLSFFFFFLHTFKISFCWLSHCASWFFSSLGLRPEVSQPSIMLTLNCLEMLSIERQLDMTDVIEFHFAMDWNTICVSSASCESCCCAIQMFVSHYTPTSKAPPRLRVTLASATQETAWTRAWHTWLMM